MSKPKVLIVPDMKGWAIDQMSKGIISSLSKQIDFDKKFPDELNDINYENYDILYFMIPGYIPKDLKTYENVRTTLHGGPSVEGQVDEIKRENKKGLRVSFTSYQTRERSKKIGYNLFHHTPYGVDIKHFAPSPKSGSTWHDPKLRAGYAGWAHYLMNKQSNHRRGYWIIKAQEELTFKMRIAGGIPSEKKWIEIFKQIHPNIECNAYSYDLMPNFYHNINLYLIPDRRAGGPMPLLEAGACCVPSVTTKCGLSADIIQDGKTGLVVSSYTEFRDAIVWIRDNPTERKQLGRNIRDYVHKHHTWDAVSGQWYKFLME